MESAFVAAGMHGYSGLAVFPTTRILPPKTLRVSYRSQDHGTVYDFFGPGDALETTRDMFIASYRVVGNLEVTLSQNSVSDSYRAFDSSLHSHARDDFSYSFIKVIPTSKNLPYRLAFFLSRTENEKTGATLPIRILGDDINTRRRYTITGRWEDRWGLVFSAPRGAATVLYAGYFRFREKSRVRREITDTVYSLTQEDEIFVKRSNAYLGLAAEHMVNDRLRLSGELLQGRGQTESDFHALTVHYKFHDFLVVDLGKLFYRKAEDKVFIGVSSYFGPSAKAAPEQ